MCVCACACVRMLHDGIFGDLIFEPTINIEILISDMSTPAGHFMSSLRDREKRDRIDR